MQGDVLYDLRVRELIEGADPAMRPGQEAEALAPPAAEVDEDLEDAGEDGAAAR